MISVPGFLRIGFLNISLIFIITGCPSYYNNQSDGPQEGKGFLQIPGAGWQTFFRTAQDDSTLSRLPFKSECAYMHWTWGNIFNSNEPFVKVII